MKKDAYLPIIIFFYLFTFFNWQTESQAGTVSGHITDSNGNPIANLHVEIYNDMCWEGDIITGGNSTDAGGNYSINGIPDGTVYIHTNAGIGTTNYVDKWWDGTNGSIYCEEATPITTIGNQETSNVNFSLDLGGSVSGTVTDSNGNPISDLHIEVYDDTCWEGSVITGGTPTDSNGSYTIKGVPTGSVYIHTNAGIGTTNYVDKWWDGTNGSIYCEEVTSITITEDQDTAGINFSLDIGGSISGTITDSEGNPIVDIHIEILDEMCGEGHAITSSESTDSYGSYTIYGVPVMPIYVHAAASASGQDYNDEWWDGIDGTTDCQEAITVTVTANQNTGGIDMTLSHVEADDADEESGGDGSGCFISSALK